MKSILLIMFPFVLSACVTNKAISDIPSQNAEPNRSLLAFEDVCIRTAPSFSDAKAAAAKYGITEIEDFGFTNSGMSKDNSIGVQIKQNTECVITTPPQKNTRLTREFLGLISKASKAPMPSRVPTKATINGVTFIFQHDRNGGEAFVMLKAND